MKDKFKQKANLWKQTWAIRAFGLLYVPLIFTVRPQIVHLTEAEAIIKIPLRRKTKNHVRSMYFGALAIGVDITAGFLAMQHILKKTSKVDLIFKDFKAEFLKKAMGDVFFKCAEGEKIKSSIDQCIQSQERVHQTVEVVATVPNLSDEIVARFSITLSLKARPKK